MLGKAAPNITLLLLPVLIIFAILLSGLYYFKMMEKTFADII